jgi:hypothetical protein
MGGGSIIPSPTGIGKKVINTIFEKRMEEGTELINIVTEAMTRVNAPANDAELTKALNDLTKSIDNIIVPASEIRTEVISVIDKHTNNLTTSVAAIPGVGFAMWFVAVSSNMSSMITSIQSARGKSVKLESSDIGLPDTLDELVKLLPAMNNSDKTDSPALDDDVATALYRLQIQVERANKSRIFFKGGAGYKTANTIFTNITTFLTDTDKAVTNTAINIGKFGLGGFMYELATGKRLSFLRAVLTFFGPKKGGGASDVTQSEAAAIEDRIASRMAYLRSIS